MTEELICEVQMWGRRVGALAETDGQISFQYDPQYISNGYSISPFEIPLSPSVFSYPNRDPAFQGLLGIFADSLPDKFGNAIIEQYFRNKFGSQRYELSALQKLMYVGRRAIGALEYLPPEQPDDDRIQTSLEIAQLVDEARHVIQGDLHVKSSDIMQVGVSAGGQYPKAVIAWNKDTNDVISGLGECPQGYQPWIIKFDGAQSTPQEFGKLEYAYSLMAKAAGIDMAETHLLQENGRHHYMVKRFDRLPDNDKFHMASLCGLLHKDFNIPRLMDYEDYLRTTLALTQSHVEQQQAYRRMVFNVVTRNQDDHTKNFSFLMDLNGRWKLSPAYDLTFAFGNHFTARHQMTINGKDDDFNRTDLLDLANKLNIDNATSIIDEVVTAAAAWPDFAERASLSTTFYKSIGETHRLI